MGKAKQRGTFEQRKAQAIERLKITQAESDRLDDLKYAERCKTRLPHVNVGVIGGGMSRQTVMIAAALSVMNRNR